MSLLNGLSTMGASIASTAGSAALELQKSQLEEEKEQLASQLAEGRESRMESQRQAGQEKLIPLQTEANIKVAQATSDFGVTAHGKELKQETDAAISKVKALSQPDMLAAQRAITMASTLPNYSLQIGDDGSAQLLNTLTGQVKPATDASGTPVKFQNPAQMQAITAQVNALRDHSRDVDYAYRQELTAASSAYKTDPSEANKAAIQAVKDKYDPLLNDIGHQFEALTTALGGKSGLGVALPSKPASPKFKDGDTIRQQGHIFKVINGKPVDQGPDPAAADR